MRRVLTEWEKLCKDKRIPHHVPPPRPPALPRCWPRYCHTAKRWLLPLLCRLSCDAVVGDCSVLGASTPGAADHDCRVNTAGLGGPRGTKVEIFNTTPMSKMAAGSFRWICPAGLSCSKVFDLRSHGRASTLLLRCLLYRGIRKFSVRLV